jgi:molybdopterin-guanine dinucleotide biosynthesis protein A
MGVTGIILAGGRSSRMGREKALLEAEGETLTERAIKTLSPLCSKIVISTNSAELFSSFNLNTVPDFTINLGPLAGIASALEQSETESNIVIAVDMPGITTLFLAYLLECFPGYNGVVPVSDKGVIQPLCGVYSSSLLPSIKELLKSNRLAAAAITDLHGILKVHALPETPGYTKELFANLNTPDELERWGLSSRH